MVFFIEASCQAPIDTHKTVMIWINVTTSIGWARPPVGVVRVEVETCIHFLERQSETSRLCRWLDGVFYHVKSEDYLFHINNLNQGFYDNSVTLNADTPVEFGFGDVFLSLGLDWDHGFLSYIRQLKRVCFLKVIGCCYDIIPILFPHYCVGDVASFFASYFIELAATADHILCISENSKNDLTNFLLSAGSFVPPLSVFRLGDAVTNDKSASSDAWPSELKRGLNYILMVSTIERRKNHQAAYLALRRIIQDELLPPGLIPHLVIVGMRGWGVEEFFSDLALDPVIRGYIHVLNHVSDEELRNLYLDSRFTLYPSYYEGWGLPVCESLCYGKVVIASGTSSLPEAGSNYALYCDPYSSADWALNIVELCRDDSRLAELEQHIQSGYTPFTWKQTAQQVFDVVCLVAMQASPLSVAYEPGYELSTLSGIHIGGVIVGDASQPGIVLFGPHINLPTCSLKVQVELNLGSCYNADFEIRLASSQGEIFSKQLNYSATDVHLHTMKSIGSDGSFLISLPVATIDRPVSDVEVVIHLFSGKGHFQINKVTFVIDDIRIGVKPSLKQCLANSPQCLGSVNVAIRAHELDQASLILDQIRDSLSPTLYGMKCDEIERRRLFPLP